MTPPTTTASAQSTLEKVRELQKLEQWATVGPWIMNDLSPRQYRVGSNATGKALSDMRYKNGCHDGRFIASVRNAFPEIASLVESQAKRIAELEKVLERSSLFALRVADCSNDPLLVADAKSESSFLSRTTHE